MQTAQATTGQATVQALLQQYSDMASKISAQTQKAINPQQVAGGLNPSVGGKMGLSFGQPQFAPPQGHADARNQGIAKTVAGVGNLVSMFIKHKQESEQRQLAQKIHGVMDANDSVSQARQVLQADPNNADAKAALKKAQDHINDAFADPKTAKKLEKAFDINQIDPSKNTDPAHKALQQATKSYAQQLEEKQNQKLQGNVIEKQKLDLMQQQQAAIAAQIKATMPQAIQEQKMAQQSAMQQNAINAKNAQTEFIQQHEDWKASKHEANENLRKAGELLTQIKTTGMRDSTALKISADRLKQQKDLYDMRLKALDKAKNSPEAKLRVMTSYIKTMQDEADKADKAMQNNNLMVKNGNVADKEKYWANNRAQEALKDAASSAMTSVQKEMDYFIKHGVLPSEDEEKMPMAPSGLEDDKDPTNPDNF
jgi:hypothetical protein